MLSLYPRLCCPTVPNAWGEGARHCTPAGLPHQMPALARSLGPRSDKQLSSTAPSLLPVNSGSLGLRVGWAESSTQASGL